jgi:adenylate cyclase
MGIEIERKFLVKNESWKTAADDGRICKQGYLCSGKGRTVRVRAIGGRAFLTIKGPTRGISRSEFEYAIPVEEAEAMLQLCGDLIEKTRYLILHAGMQWELDVFSGSNAGLVMAEVELDSEDRAIELPDWAGEEVSGDVRYYNSNLSQHPFNSWP